MKRCLSVLMCAFLLLLTGCALTNGSHVNIDTGMEQLAEGDYEGALTSFSLALAEGENKRLIYRGRGIAYLQTGAYDDAIAAFDLALKETNGIVTRADYDLNFYLAESYLKSERYSLAESVYSTILSLKKEDADAYYLRGVARLKGGNLQGANEDFQAAVDLKPQDYDRLFLICEAYEEAGYMAEGQTLLNGVYENVKDTLSDYERGRFAYYAGDLTEAMKALEAARSGSGPEVIEAVLLLGRVAEEQGDFDYAEGIYRAYLKNNRENARVYNRLGLCELKSGRLDAAISDFESGISLDDKTMRQDLAWNIIVAYEMKGEFGTAFDLTKQYLTRYPTDEKALREYTFLSTR